MYDTSPFRLHGAIVPRDVAAPTNASGAPAEFNGLYTEGSDALNCCWISPHATLLVRKHGAATRLVAGFWVPNFPRFADGQDVSIAFAGNRAPPRRASLDVGEQTSVTMPVPPNLRASVGLIPVLITCAVDYVPARDAPASHSVFTMLHLRASQASGDTRPLGIILLYLYFE